METKNQCGGVSPIGTSVVVLVAALWSPAPGQVTERVNVSTAGVQANDLGQGLYISADGRYAAFHSWATNLVPSDTNGVSDIFVRDRQSGTTERVSVDSLGAQANGGSDAASISADGRYVAFASAATNLAAGDANSYGDIFVRDRLNGTTEIISLDSAGVQANNDSWASTISADGRYVAFVSLASNLAPLDSNGEPDIFVRDRLNGTTECVSVDPAGATGNGYCDEPSISGDGSCVAFFSYASNLVQPGTNGDQHIFVRDRLKGTTEVMSVNSMGTEANSSSSGASISADGRYVAFASYANNLVSGDTNNECDVFVRDRLSITTARMSVDWAGAQGNSQSHYPSISADGRHVAFASAASNLVAGDINGDWDIFVRNRQSGMTELVSITSIGEQANGYSALTSISQDGRYVEFFSAATNLVPDDTNGYEDYFVRDRGPCSPCIVNYCTAKVNSSGCTPQMSWSGTPSASAGSSFDIGATQVLPDREGILFYSTHGPDSAPFQGGHLCVRPPKTRTPPHISIASGAQPCTGVYSYDFNARIASGVDPALVVAQSVWCQYWTRDAGVPTGTGLTNALTFTIGF